MNKTFSFLFLLCALGCSHLKNKVQKRSLIYRSWGKSFDYTYKEGNLPISSEGPHIEVGTLWVGDRLGQFFAYESASGKELWKVDLKSPIVGTPATVPAMDMVITGSEKGRVFSLNKYSGEELWAIDLPSPIDAQPLIKGSKVFMNTRDHRFYCIDVSTGRTLWHYQRPVSLFETIYGSSNIVFKDNVVFHGFADGFLAAFGIENGRKKWEVQLRFGDKFIDLDSNIQMLKNGTLVVTSLGQGVYFIRPSDGKILKKIETKAVSNISISENGEVYFVSSLGSQFFLNRIKKDSQEVTKELLLSRKIVRITHWGDDLMGLDSSGRFVQIDEKGRGIKLIDDLGHQYSTIYTPIAMTNKYLSFMSSRNRLYHYSRL